MAEIEKFARHYPRRFFRPVRVKKHFAEFRGPAGISLYERLASPIDREEFLLILEQTVAAVRQLQLANLSLSYLVSDIRYVYVNEMTREIFFLYIPAAAREKGRGLPEFLEALVYSAKPETAEGQDFLSRFARRFQGSGWLDADELERFLSEERGEAKQGGLPDFEEETGLLTEAEDTEGTALLAQEGAEACYPALSRILTGETIYIDKPVYRLGKERSYVDYFVTNNIAVSRSHADIITRGNRYYIKDLNSKNHTYINSRKIPAQLETELHDGDVIRLGNEEFIFRV